MKILNLDGEVIGNCETVDQNKNTIQCNNVVLDIDTSCTELKDMFFKLSEVEGSWKITNIPFFFSNRKRTIVAVYSHGSQPSGGYVLLEKAS